MYYVHTYNDARARQHTHAAHTRMHTHTYAHAQKVHHVFPMSTDVTLVLSSLDLRSLPPITAFPYLCNQPIFPCGLVISAPSFDHSYQLSLPCHRDVYYSPDNAYLKSRFIRYLLFTTSFSPTFWASVSPSMTVHRRCPANA